VGGRRRPPIGRNRRIAAAPGPQRPRDNAPPEQSSRTATIDPRRPRSAARWATRRLGPPVSRPRGRSPRAADRPEEARRSHATDPCRSPVAAIWATARLGPPTRPCGCQTRGRTHVRRSGRTYGAAASHRMQDRAAHSIPVDVSRARPRPGRRF
jgi:hypothetical protein